MFASLLIANRGEIACRIARTARRMGITAIAVHSDADEDALHVREADRAIRIGPAAARASYLDIGAVIEAARSSGAAAVHPGYGFLSENAEFAEAVIAAGMAWIGPPPAAMRAMGSKSAAKAAMAAAGVPVLPGYHGAAQDPASLAREAALIGFPVMIKAVAGGGGRGMRMVRDAAGFAPALAAAQQEAQGAFGDARVLIEKLVERPRHVEMQVFGDTHGNVVHLFERDCSAQRRHQKVIEEAPAPGLDPMLRDAMGQAGIAAARAVGYVGAGTVEFVVADGAFWFLEMNTRLQVEHPVTELITGFDLVEWQIRIAAGEALPASGERIRARGHAIEARLYAEDPARDFAPSIGRLLAFRMPQRARVDAGYAAGDSVSAHYDAMLGKIICHAATREEARRQLLHALRDCVVAGVATNRALLAAILDHADFAAGTIDTGWIGRNLDALAAAPAPDAEVLAAAAAALLAAETRAAARAMPSPWEAADGWWLNTDPARRLVLLQGETAHEIVVRAPNQGRSLERSPGWRIEAGGREMAVEAVEQADGGIGLRLDGARETIWAARDGDLLALDRRGIAWRFRLPADPAEHAAEEAAGAALIAPIPGLVTAIAAAAGQRVARGETLVVLEAMKTVFRLAARADALVASVACRVGESVAEGQVLIGFADAEP